VLDACLSRLAGRAVTGHIGPGAATWWGARPRALATTHGGRDLGRGQNGRADHVADSLWVSNRLFGHIQERPERGDQLEGGGL
jgi:hypothetical protein